MRSCSAVGVSRRCARERARSMRPLKANSLISSPTRLEQGDAPVFVALLERPCSRPACAIMVERMTEADKRAQARRERMTLRKTRVGEPEVDFSPTFGAEAISLVYRLTRTSYGLAGLPRPEYTRETIPCRFVPRRTT